MTNEEILREYTDVVCSGGHAEKAFIRALSLARVDELRKAAGEAETFVNTENPSSEQVAFWLRCKADKLELEATK